MSARRSDFAWCAAFALALGLLSPRLDRIERTDPDRYYHYALSRAAAAGEAHVLPQVIGLGWDQHFDEKEWLFHVLTGAAWRAAKERGVDGLCLALGWLDLVLVYFLCRRGQGPLLAGAFVLVTCLASSHFLFRVLMVRPHLLGLACGLALVHALLWRRAWAVVLAATLFALSYHALFVPLALAGLFALNQHRSRQGWKLLGAAGLGLALGTVLSPAFPGNLWSTWVGWKIAWTTASDPSAGVENAPLPLLEFLVAFGPCVAGFLAAATQWRRADPDRQRRFFLLAAGSFWLLALRIPRAAEYAVPFTAVALSFSAVALRPWLALAGAMLLGSLPGQLRLTTLLPIHTYNEGIARSVLALPAAGQHTVLNCSFADGAYLLYLRPNLRFVDLLDPLLLKTKNPELAAAREAVWRGEGDPWDLATRRFPADYVVCGYPAARARIEADPRFRRVHPAPGLAVPRSSGPPVYEVLR